MYAFKMLLGFAAARSSGQRFLLQKFSETALNNAAAHFGANKIMECSVNQLRERELLLISCLGIPTPFCPVLPVGI